MYPRTNYEMTPEDLEKLLYACEPVPCMMIGNRGPVSPQENANRAWQALGQKYGFDWTTVRPVEGKGDRFFSAVPSENETQRAERQEREARENRKAEIARLQGEIEERQAKLAALKEE